MCSNNTDAVAARRRARLLGLRQMHLFEHPDKCAMVRQAWLLERDRLIQELQDQVNAFEANPERPRKLQRDFGDT